MLTALQNSEHIIIAYTKLLLSVEVSVDMNIIGVVITKNRRNKKEAINYRNKVNIYKE